MCSKKLFKRFMVLCVLLVVLRLPLAGQSYSISEEQLNEIQTQTEIMRQQLQELNAQLIESQKSLQKSKKINSVLATVLAGIAAGTVTVMILK